MRARVGDLAIVRFDPSESEKRRGIKYDEKVGLVIGSYSPDNGPREYYFIYWHMSGNKLVIENRDLPANRLVRARPKNDDWEGTLFSLTLENVEAV